MRLYVIIFVCVALTLIPVFLFDDEIDAAFAGPEGLRRLQEYGGWAWLVGVGLIVADLVLPVPSTAVIAGLGMLYGPPLGGLVGGVGSTLAGLVAYAGGRWLGRPAIRLFAGDSDLEKLRRFFARHGLWAVALSRWMPLLPEALCCLAGAARMRVGPFSAALACGSFAMGFAFGVLGEHYLDRPAVGLVVSAAIPLLVWPPVHFYLKRRPVVEADSPVA
ncbi:TVP38/TMEM64 family protein [Urbifossiella limnaea]|uniref:TVP38/TMEM64 family inner membrane protein YdjZ n=1 Tax=Urbifossiella limnaea TaxID=2528023 RepID=A0A517XQ47_9BACT|nr:VTT domain-containing protein [Urbifossiella limnaea]QDU19631.1 TVP38/TMEM64 family inner membrane protein YdjZ [Urbifossiella limnaea]